MHGFSLLLIKYFGRENYSREKKFKKVQTSEKTQGKRYPGMLAHVPKISDRTRLKILTSKQMLQRFPIALAQLKAGSTSKNLLNQNRQITYTLYREKEITKKVYNNIINSVKLVNIMDTVSVNSETSKTSDSLRLLPNLSDKTDLKRSR